MNAAVNWALSFINATTWAIETLKLNVPGYLDPRVNEDYAGLFT